MRKLAIVIAIMIIYLSNVPGLMVSDFNTWFNEPRYTDWSILNELKSGGIFYKPWSDFHYLDFYLQKLGHCIFYGLLALFTFWKTSNVRTFFIKLSLICLFAFLDEIHQLFIIGRSGRVMDVFVDVSSVLVVVCVMMWMGCLWSKETKTLIQQ